jgi:glycosyltransferase involved in cell wall biosynthesis
MILVAIVPFLDEEEHLPSLLATIERQERLPDSLVLVDDGSSDRSPAIAREFARRHPFATVLHRERRPPERDRMVQAPELKAFTWALDQVPQWDVAGKLDADLALSTDFFAEIERRFAADPGLGMGGAYLAARDEHGRPQRQRCPPTHVEGENTFYRRACWAQIAPLPAILGWDTIDEVRARMHGWRTASFAMASGDPLHLRRMGSHDGLLRGFRRAGLSAYAYGAHPAHVLLAGAARMADRPRVLCGAHYLAGWGLAALRGAPRAEPELRAFVARENLGRIRAVARQRLAARGRRAPAAGA